MSQADLNNEISQHTLSLGCSAVNEHYYYVQMPALWKAHGCFLILLLAAV